MIRMAKKSDFNEVYPILEQIFDEMQLKSIAAIAPDDFFELLRLGWETEDYRYSYKRTIVDEEDGRVAGMLTSYSAQDEEIIDQPLKQYYRRFNLPSDLEIFTDKESMPGEWYLDSLAVSPVFQGRGIGSRLLDFAPNLAKKNGYKKISLNVDQANGHARHLYIKKGFIDQGEIKIGDHQYDHMIKEVN